MRNKTIKYVLPIISFTLCFPHDTLANESIDLNVLNQITTKNDIYEDRNIYNKNGDTNEDIVLSNISLKAESSKNTTSKDNTLVNSNLISTTNYDVILISEETPFDIQKSSYLLERENEVLSLMDNLPTIVQLASNKVNEPIYIYQENDVNSKIIAKVTNSIFCETIDYDENNEWTHIKYKNFDGYVFTRQTILDETIFSNIYKEILTYMVSYATPNQSDILAFEVDNPNKSIVLDENTSYKLIEKDEQNNTLIIEHNNKHFQTSYENFLIEDMELDLVETFENNKDDILTKISVDGDLEPIYYLNNQNKPMTQEQVDAYRQSIVDFASQYIGNPYVWGGTSLTNGADCSGFAQSVYKNFGYALNRTASSQSHNGIKVSRDELQPGDLVFYHKSDETTISHVAIYAGDGQIVHAANSKVGIIVSKLDYMPISCYRRIAYAE